MTKKQPKLQVRTAGPPVPAAAPPAPRKTPKRKTTKPPVAVEPQHNAQPAPDPELESHPDLEIDAQKNDPEQKKGADSLVLWWYESD